MDWFRESNPCSKNQAHSRRNFAVNKTNFAKPRFHPARKKLNACAARVWAAQSSTRLSATHDENRGWLGAAVIGNATPGGPKRILFGNQGEAGRR
jgi:hypothetical protein